MSEMFEFCNDIKELKNNILEYRYQNYGGKVVIVQGYKDIIFFDENSVCLKLKTGEITLSGENLKVEEFSSNTIKIIGKILKIEQV